MGHAWEEFGEGDVVGGRYRIVRRVGRGGMGSVYRAEDTHLHRFVALKVIRQEHAERPEYREAFLRESQLAARIEHPNVVSVYDADDDNGRLFLAMQYVEGQHLEAHIQLNGPLRWSKALQYLREIASALDAIHAYSLVHADVKPANILIAGGHAFLTDFGIARESHVIGTGGLPDDWMKSISDSLDAGTPAYMAPEQWLGERLDWRVDVYALGGILHTMLTGHPPYERGDIPSLRDAHLNEPPPSPSLLVPDLSDEVDDIVRKAMAKDPGDRYQSGEELVVAACAKGEPRPLRRMVRPFAVVGGGLVVVVAALLAVTASLGGSPPTSTTNRSVVTTVPPGAVAPAEPSATVGCGSDYDSPSSGEAVTVTKSSSALVHNGPAADCPGKFRAKPGDSLVALCYVINRANNQWTYFNNDAGQRGWIWNEYLSPLPSTTPRCE